MSILIPEDLTDPITKDLIINPVTIANPDNEEGLKCGHTFDKASIAQWLLQHPTCPLCRQIPIVAYPNTGLAKEINKFVNDPTHPENKLYYNEAKSQLPENIFPLQIIEPPQPMRMEEPPQLQQEQIQQIQRSAPPSQIRVRENTTLTNLLRLAHRSSQSTQRAMQNMVLHIRNYLPIITRTLSTLPNRIALQLSRSQLPRPQQPRIITDQQRFDTVKRLVNNQEFNQAIRKANEIMNDQIFEDTIMHIIFKAMESDNLQHIDIAKYLITNRIKISNRNILLNILADKYISLNQFKKASQIIKNISSQYGKWPIYKVLYSKMFFYGCHQIYRTIKRVLIFTSGISRAN